MKKIDMLDDDYFDNEISEFLNSYTAEKVPEEMIDSTIDSLRKYMPPKKTKNLMVTLIKNEVTYINKSYFIAATILVAISLAFSMQYNLNLYSTLMIISPMPMILGMFQIVKSTQNNMWELEKSFKFSYSNIILARLTIITSFSAIINIALFIICGYGTSGYILCKMLFSIIVPISIVSSINLLLLTKLNNNSSIITSLIVWITIIGSSKTFIIPYLEAAKVVSLTITIIISLMIFSYSLYKFYCTSITFEGEEMLWN